MTRPAVPIEGKHRALLSCDVASDGLTVAAGTELQQDDAIIVYWCAPTLVVPSEQLEQIDGHFRDPRRPAAPLRKHTSTHSDDITSVHFSRTSSERSRDVLLSGSTDGLVCISNADEEDEDEAVVYVGNLGSSISQAGWMPRRAARTGAWAATDMETFSLWSDEVRNFKKKKTIRLPFILFEKLFSDVVLPSSILRTIWIFAPPLLTPKCALGSPTI